MLLGPDWLGKISPVCIPFSGSLGQWSGTVVTIVGATMFLGGVDLGKATTKGMACTLLSGTLYQAQLLIGLLIACLFSITIMPSLPFQFGEMPVYGFFLGHGNAAVAGGMIVDAGFWGDALGVAMTFATAGELFGIIGGSAYINWGAKRGLTHKAMRIADMPKEERRGYVEPENRRTIGKAVTSPSAVDPLAFCLAIVGVILVAVYLSKQLVGICLPNAASYIPASMFALLVSSMIIGAITFLITLTLGKRWMGNYENWFELSAGQYGQSCGVLATGLMLCRVMDSLKEVCGKEGFQTVEVYGIGVTKQMKLNNSVVLMTIQNMKSPR